ncbi:MAG: family 43 glycosylhydrolase [Deltaproteobacteria bacterium]|nr:family 43 glycosylhydrolase [Deltaproteobacteria bacterium]
MKSLLAALALVCALPQVVWAQTLLTPGYQFNSDPTCRELNGRLYLFTTHDQSTVNFQGPEDFWHSMFDYHAYSTTDFKHWIDHGSALSIHDAAWATDLSVWDGDLGIPANGKFYAYVPFRSKGFEIGVLVADRPEGPYRDPLGKPLMTTAIMREHGIALKTEAQPKQADSQSPTIVRDENGVPYLLFGQMRVFAVKLKPSMTELDGKVFEIDVPLRGGEATEYVEGPWIHRMGNKFYFSYMTYKNWEGKTNSNFTNEDPAGPYIQYAVSDKLFGPYAKPKHWIYPVAPDAANNQHGVCTYKGQWYVAYHVPYEGKQHRQVAITRLRTNKHGDLLPIYPGKDPGVVPKDSVSLVLDAFAHKREAEEFHTRRDAFEERGKKQDFHFKLKQDGFLHFRNVDFGAGATGFKAHVSCENSKIHDARLEFHLDAPDGPKIGESPVRFTYWITYYQELTGAVQGAKGVHDVYLVAKGEGGDAYGRLFNVDWFTFTR